MIKKLYIGAIQRKNQKILKVQNRKTNVKINLIKAWAIILVVCGHTSQGGIHHFMSNWVHYTFYFMPLFIFTSGYFYKKETDETSIYKFLKSKFFTLVVPYFLWNIVYGVVTTLLRNAGIVNYGDRISLNSLFIRPWIDGHQFGFNIPAWFLLSLFIVVCATFLIRKVLSKLNILNDFVLLLVFFVVSLVSIYFSQKEYNFGWYLCFLRAGYLLPYFQLGYVYKKYESWFSKYKGVFFCAAPIIYYLILAYLDPIYLISVFAKFTGEPIIITLMTALCVILVADVAEILAPAFENNKIVRYLGDNTFTVMMHHPFFIFLLNVTLYFISHFTDLASFEVEKFKNTVWYFYPWRDSRISFFYMVFAVTAPLIIKFLFDKAVLRLNEKANKNNC